VVALLQRPIHHAHWSIGKIFRVCSKYIRANGHEVPLFCPPGARLDILGRLILCYAVIVHRHLRYDRDWNGKVAQKLPHPKRDASPNRPQGWAPPLLSLNVDLSDSVPLRPQLASPKFLPKRETQTSVSCLESEFFLPVGP